MRTGGALLAAVAIMAEAAAAPALEPGVSRELARWRAAHYGDVRYALNVSIAAPVAGLAGELEIRVAVRGKPVDLVLDWRPPPGGRLARVEANGIPIEKDRKSVV